MKQHKLIFLLLFVFGLYATGLGDLLLREQGMVLCFDKDSDSSEQDTDEATDTEKNIDDNIITDFITYLYPPQSLVATKGIWSKNVLLTYHSDILAVVAPPPEV